MTDNAIHENLIEITKYELMGELPDPFVFNDGTRMTDPAEWSRRRAEIYRDAIDLQYGTMPPAPEFIEVEPIYLGGRGSLNSYRIITGTRAKPITFTMYIFKARCKEKAPAVISGDMCFISAFRESYVNALLDNDINFVTFNRTELAHDIARYNLNGLDKDSGEYATGDKLYEGLDTGNCGGQVKNTYPDYTFGAVGAWAWGYSRCVDALEILGNVDLNMLVFTGHSRGGKTAALAGAVDERAAIVNPNATCSGGYSSYRIHIEAVTEEGSIKKSEPLSNIFHHFPAWMGQGMKPYIGREDELPFDAHHLKAMVAPRVLFVSEAASDIMANPVGSYQTTEAAAEVFKFLGCEENLIWTFRRGGHGQTVEDIGKLVNVIKHVKNGEPLNDAFFKLPFKPMKPAYSWKCPDSKKKERNAMTVSEICQAIHERLENENIGTISGVERPLLKISNRYQGLWLEHLYDSVLYAKMDGSKLYLAENAVYEFIARQRENGQLPLAMTSSGVGYSHVQECVSFGKLCLMIYEMNGDRDFLRKAYDALAKWVGWLRRYRMTTERGLVEQFVGYDTGHDNSLRNAGMGCQGRYQKTREISYDADVFPPDDGVTPILAVDMNCNFYGNHVALARMAEILGEPAAPWRERAAEIKKRLFEECFNAEDCFFYDVDRNGNQRKCLCSTIFHLFIEEILHREQDRVLIDEIYRRHISNPSEFATPYPFPPIAICDPAWKKLQAQNCWGYYTQGNIVIRTTLWMEQYGFVDGFEKVCRAWVEAWTAHYDEVKVGQELDPLTGVPSKCSEWYSAGMIFYLYAAKRLGF